jgi:5'-nucleotidase
MGTRALVTNDDGISSDGLRILALAAEEAGLDVTVAAPDREASGSGAGLTAVQTDGRVVIAEHPLDGLASARSYAVAALPGFIAAVGTRGAFGDPPEVVLSGINRGPNTGHAVIHSGTVGAALTAAANGCPGIAVSLDLGPDPDAPPRWDTAARVLVAVLPAVLGAAEPMVLNVNVPDVTVSELAGIRQARLSRFGAAEMRVVEMRIAEEGAGFVRVTQVETGAEPEEGTDVALLAAGFATVTAIRGICELDGKLAIPGRLGRT